MKKTIIFFIIIIITITACGCRKNGDIPSVWLDDYNTALEDSHSLLIDSKIGDFDSFLREVNLVSETIESKKDFAVSFIYECHSESTVYPLPYITWDTLFSYEFRRVYSEGQKTDWLKAQIVRSLFYFFFLNDKYKIDDNGDVIGAIFAWVSKDLSGNEIDRYYICDFDGDGVWDYGSKHNMSIASNCTPSLDEIYREVGDGRIYLSIEGNYVVLEDLTGEESLKDIEKIINKGGV